MTGVFLTLTFFSSRKTIKKLKKLSFSFQQQAAGSHEIWYCSNTNLYTAIPNHPGDISEGTCKSNSQTSWYIYFCKMNRLIEKYFLT